MHYFFKYFIKKYLSKSQNHMNIIAPHLKYAHEKELILDFSFRAKYGSIFQPNWSFDDVYPSSDIRTRVHI